MAAAARFMAGMSGRTVDGLEGGDAAGHLKLRGGKRVGKVAESSEVAPSAQAVCQSSNADDSNIALGASACAGLRVTRASGEQRARSMLARYKVYPSRQPSFTDGWKRLVPTGTRRQQPPPKQTTVTVRSWPTEDPRQTPRAMSLLRQRAGLRDQLIQVCLR